MALLFDLAERPEGPIAVHNVYFALRPDPQAARALCSLAGARRLDPERLHISLYSLGRHADLPHEPIGQATIAARALRVAPFVVALDRFGTWGRGQGVLPVVAWADDGVIGVRRLHERLCAVLADATGRRREPALEPHLTLWRDVARTPPSFMAPIAWRVREFVLLDSLQGGGRQAVLARFPSPG